MVFEEQIEIAEAPETVFAVYRDVEGWGNWDPEVAAASLEGEFTPGTPGRLTPTSGRPKEARFTITEVVPNDSFAVESRLPLCLLRFDHELTPTSGGVRALHRVTISGPLSGVLGRFIGGPIRRGLPGTMAGLKLAAESSHGGNRRD